ncbi:NAD(P)H-dependent oxidoreductase [Pedobacter sp. P26]|uniref:NAD(P)H-dependent oxidoreductase n=1 Tax=Pedobacter sp. P26 TaxID=3423956 RepID=UPI003D66A850
MKILHLISSPRGEASFSIKLGNAIVEKLQAANPGSTLTTHDLTNTPFSAFGGSTYQFFLYTAGKSHRRIYGSNKTFK